MGFVPNGFGEITYRYGLSGDPEDKTFSIGFRSLIGSSLANLQSAWLAMAAQYYASFHSTGAPTMAVPWEFRGVHVRMKVAGVEYVEEQDNLVVGSASTPVVTVNTCPLVKKKTGLAGRANRGRIFHPPFGLDEAHVTPAGVLDTSIRDDYNDQWAAFLTAAVADDAQPVLLHGIINTGVLNPTPPPKWVYEDPTAAPVDITSFEVEPKVATQRRRMR